MSSYFYLQAEQNSKNANFLEKLREFAETKKRLVYVLNRPLSDSKYKYEYLDALIVLSPKCKIAIVDFGDNSSKFEDYVEDVIEDVGSIADKFLYKEVIGRPRQWRLSLVKYDFNPIEVAEIESFFNDIELNDTTEIKKLDLLISLFIGSINDIERVKKSVPQTPLEKVKQKIQLFDGDQTRFIYKNSTNKRVVIQGLSGTGKTELLLHKLKDIYVEDNKSKIYFTCHNKILADNLRKRIPSFFNFMKVEQQIEWENRLWCTNAWGSGSNPNSGVYSYICAFYEIPFNRYSRRMTFKDACNLALDVIKKKTKTENFEFAFTHIFMDESQDFEENFFELCELVTQKHIYIAGDVFQSIFDYKLVKSIRPDFLLGKCYRTDPKTLMFAHALGMGLFEEQKLRWLEENEWEACGYNVNIIDNSYYLSREPLRRFEDLEDGYESIEIVEAEGELAIAVLEVLYKIKKENETVVPDDIGIILIDEGDEIYRLADILEINIELEFDWSVNKAYETKESLKNKILISNRNNVKGLEFPFVICVTNSIGQNLSYRNSLYTMLTRSFLKSFLVIPKSSDSGLTEEMKIGLEEIFRNNQMKIESPSESEKIEIRTKFELQTKQQSLYERMTDVFKKLRVDKKYQEKLRQASTQFEMSEYDTETLVDWVNDMLKYIKES